MMSVSVYPRAYLRKYMPDLQQIASDSALVTIVRVYKLYLLTYLLIIYVLRVTNGRGSVLLWRH